MNDETIRFTGIRKLTESLRFRDSLRLVIAAPRLVVELVRYAENRRAYYEEQLRRRDADLQEIRGRRSVEVEAAGREGWRQGLDTGDQVLPDHLISNHPLNLGLVYAAAIEAQPNEVLGEMKMVAKGGLRT